MDSTRNYRPASSAIEDDLADNSLLPGVRERKTSRDNKNEKNESIRTV